jgi:uncharacterized protein (UPF0276 family)
VTEQLCGVGIGLRRPLYDAILGTTRRIDWLELVPENFMDLGGRPAAVLEACAARWPIVSHGVSLSIGGPDPLSERYLRSRKELEDNVAVAASSDHLCYTSIHGVELHELLPLPFTEEALRWSAARAKEAAERLGRPLWLENITYYAEMPGTTMREGEFVRAVLESAECDLLLDVNNTYLNARNHGRDPIQVLTDLPLERTRQIHLAGHVEDEGILLDHHGSAVAPAVWDLFREALVRVGPVPVLIEWDQNIPSLDRVLDEADHARAILEDVCRARPIEAA